MCTGSDGPEECVAPLNFFRVYHAENAPTVGPLVAIDDLLLLFKEVINLRTPFSVSGASPTVVINNC